MVKLLRLLSHLPLPILYSLADIIALPLRYFYRRKVVVKNLQLSFPEWDSRKLNQVVNEFYQRFADFLVEVIKGIDINEGELKKRVKFINPEIVQQTNQGSLLVFAAHQMNWEWMALANSFYFPYPAKVIYQPLSDPASDRFMLQLRSRFGCTPLPRDRSIRVFLRHRKEPGVIGIVADQITKHQSKDWARFLNQETPFAKGITQLPYLTQSMAVFAHIRRKKRGYYEVTFEKIGEPPYFKGELTVLKNYINASEQMIRSDPAGWLWTHRRWKYSREQNEELLIL